MGRKSRQEMKLNLLFCSYSIGDYQPYYVVVEGFSPKADLKAITAMRLQGGEMGPRPNSVIYDTRLFGFTVWWVDYEALPFEAPGDLTTDVWAIPEEMMAKIRDLSSYVDCGDDVLMPPIRRKADVRNQGPIYFRKAYDDLGIFEAPFHPHDSAYQRLDGALQLRLLSGSPMQIARRDGG